MKKSFLNRLFGRLFKRKLSEREAEIAFRCKIAEMNRTATALKRAADKSKAEALTLEKAGDHQRAVAAANTARTQERCYQAALQAIQRTTTTHMTAKQQSEMTKLIAGCTDLIEDVIHECDPNEIVRVQEGFDNIISTLDTTEETLTTMLQGFAPETTPSIVNTAGEEALKQFLAEANPQPQQEVLPPVPAIPAVPAAIPAAPAEVAAQQTEHAEWATDRRKVLAELV